MAPVLQCPDCGTKHPLAQVPDTGTFPCRGCGRMLKVPEMVRPVARATAPANPPAPARAPAAAPAPPPPVPPAERTRAMPVIEQNAKRSQSPPRPLDVPASLGSVPSWMRLLCWVVAVPFSFVVVFLIARAVGLFTNNQLSDVFLADNASRFWPVIRLLPFVALLTAICVQASVYGLARLRGRRRPSVAPH